MAASVTTAHSYMQTTTKGRRSSALSMIRLVEAAGQYALTSDDLHGHKNYSLHGHTGHRLSLQPAQKVTMKPAALRTSKMSTTTMASMAMRPFQVSADCVQPQDHCAIGIGRTRRSRSYVPSSASTSPVPSSDLIKTRSQCAQQEMPML